MTLAAELVDLIAGDPVALERLRELVADDRDRDPPTSPAFTVPTLALELGRTERSIRAAIGRGELQAVKRGRGWVISAAAVADWARAPRIDFRAPAIADQVPGRRQRRVDQGPMARALAKPRYADAHDRTSEHFKSPNGR